MSLKSMSVNVTFFAIFLLFFVNSWGAPQKRSPSSSELLINNAMKQFKTAMSDLKHEMNNHESEIRMFEEKLQNQETSFEQLRQQTNDDIKAQWDFIKTANINLEGKTETLNQTVQNLESLVRSLVSDFRLIKSQANDSVNVLSQYKQKITELEKLLDIQNQQMKNLEAALQSMMEVLQAREASKNMVLKENEYKVQPGDNLEKIARSQKISVQALREANNLKNDRIIVGQLLKIP